eukprot:scaffold55362_cov12-Tisochrysis_lutea.AAC.1
MCMGSARGNLSSGSGTKQTTHTLASWAVCTCWHLPRPSPSHGPWCTSSWDPTSSAVASALPCPTT